MFNIGAVAPRGSNLFGLGDEETAGWDGERSYIRELKFDFFFLKIYINFKYLTGMDQALKWSKTIPTDAIESHQVRKRIFLIIPTRIPVWPGPEPNLPKLSHMGERISRYMLKDPW